MTDLLIQGLEISLLGIGLTFAALGLLILMMILLERLFRPKPAAQETLPSEPATGIRSSTTDEEITAAITAALLVLEEQKSKTDGLGTALEKDHGNWWRRGQAAQSSQVLSQKSDWNE